MSATDKDTIAAFDKLLESTNRSDAPGYVAGIALGGELIYQRATGLASIEFAVANTPATRMRIGSTSKTFTCLAVMLLVEDGKLDIDVPVKSYLPDLTGPNGRASLRQLMNHMGGAWDALEAVGFFLTEGLFPQIPAGVTHRWSSRMRGCNFQPGERYMYSNYGYMLLSMVIEKISGLTLAEFFRQRLFAPLGMVDSELVPNDMDLSPGLAASHIRLPDGRYRRGIYPCEELVGGGGIVSTIDDMLRWMAHLRKPDRVGNAATWAEMLGTPRFNSGMEYNYCLGLKRQKHRGVDMWWHSGSTIGSTCMMVTYPAHALDIIVMANRSDSDTTGIALKMAEAVLGKVMGEPTVYASAAAHAALAGRYFSPQSKLVFGLKAHDNKLAFSSAGTLEGFLREENGRLCSDSGSGPLALRYEAPQAGAAVTQLDLDLCGVADTLVRLPDQPPTPGELAPALVGEYRLDDFDTKVEVIFEQEVLHIDLRSRYNPCRMRLDPISGEVFNFSSRMLGTPVQGTVVFARSGGRVSGFFLSTARSRNLHFSRCDTKA